MVTRDRVRRALAGRPSRLIADTECDERAAVTLVLSEGVPESRETGEAAALFVRRAMVEGDPWSGHMALPGGRASPLDADLMATARRETCEETGLELAAEDFLGRLSDIHPRSSHLPSIAVTPFVAWHAGEPRVAVNPELAGYVWIPLRVLAAPEFRSTLRQEDEAAKRYPAIRHEGDFIWGLTMAIVEEFLSALGEESGPA